MKAPNLKAEPVVQAVGRMIRGIAVQRQQRALFRAADLLHLLDQPRADFPGPRLGVDNEVVELQILSAPDLGRDPCPAQADQLAFGKRADRPVVGMFGKNRGQTLPQCFSRSAGVQK